MNGLTPEQLAGYSCKRDIINRNGLVLVPANTPLAAGHFHLLINHGVDWNTYEFEPPRVQTNETLVTKASETIRGMFQLIRDEKRIPLEEINQSILPTIYQATDFPNLFSVLSGLQAKDDYTYRHNIGVGVISTLIGKWLQLNADDLSLLSTAATLHDVGKIHITDDILNKPGKYTEQEYEIMKKHTIFGYEIIMSSPNVSPRMALVALQHHEREDGSGYPYGIKGDQIDYYSKIVAVADIFHAMTSKRVYKDAMPFYLVVRQMQGGGFGELDPAICSLFIRRMMELAIGNDVMLTDGRQGTIKAVNPFDLVNPLIEMDGGSYVDLSQNTDVNIVSLVG
ncbi:MAG: HD-GYP domain-containing protein [Paenibacillaceae bacterium]|nr:HD-GYP domain-containing protein [Paenibacillaceae bacterium]